MSFIISVILQVIVVLIVCYVIYVIATVIFNLTRIYIYRLTSGKIDMITNDEKIRFGMIPKNVTQSNVEVINQSDVPVGSYEEFERMWENKNEVLDMQMRQSKTDPDEIFFQGRVKRRR